MDDYSTLNRHMQSFDETNLASKQRCLDRSGILEQNEPTLLASRQPDNKNKLKRIDTNKLKLSCDSESNQSEVQNFMSQYNIQKSPVPLRSPITNRTCRSPIEQPKSPSPLNIGKNTRLQKMQQMRHNEQMSSNGFQILASSKYLQESGAIRRRDVSTGTLSGSRSRSTTPNQANMINNQPERIQSNFTLNDLKFQNLSPGDQKTYASNKQHDFSTIVPLKGGSDSPKSILSPAQIEQINNIPDLKNHYMHLLQHFNQCKQVHQKLREDMNQLKQECIEFLKEFQIQNFYEQLNIAAAGLKDKGDQIIRNDIKKFDSNLDYQKFGMSMTHNDKSSGLNIPLNFPVEVLFPYIYEAKVQVCSMNKQIHHLSNNLKKLRFQMTSQQDRNAECHKLQLEIITLKKQVKIAVQKVLDNETQDRDQQIKYLCQQQINLQSIKNYKVHGTIPLGQSVPSYLKALVEPGDGLENLKDQVVLPNREIRETGIMGHLKRTQSSLNPNLNPLSKDMTFGFKRTNSIQAIKYIKEKTKNQPGYLQVRPPKVGKIRVPSTPAPIQSRMQLNYGNNNAPPRQLLNALAGKSPSKHELQNVPSIGSLIKIPTKENFDKQFKKLTDKLDQVVQKREQNLKKQTSNANLESGNINELRALQTPQVKYQGKVLRQMPTPLNQDSFEPMGVPPDLDQNSEEMIQKKISGTPKVSIKEKGHGNITRISSARQKLFNFN